MKYLHKGWAWRTSRGFFMNDLYLLDYIGWQLVWKVRGLKLFGWLKLPRIKDTNSGKRKHATWISQQKCTSRHPCFRCDLLLKVCLSNCQHPLSTRLMKEVKPWQQTISRKTSLCLIQITTACFLLTKR